MSSTTLYLVVALAPLVGAILAGLFGTGFLGRQVGRSAAHSITILGVLVSFIGSVVVLFQVLNGETFNGAVYTWNAIGTTSIEIGFLIDSLTALMMVVVTSVSLMVHIYTIG
ncbi:MAG TPA: NADH-quinone oxidoreductase subunit L, partial [Pusillimonas sp.]|nr:NADH-quinone oxidoreductase subunit L [Pusillimonas sp.]